jgi:hypothetical protein
LYDFSHMNDIEELEQKLAEYKAQHKALDEATRSIMTGGGAISLSEMQDMKKKKLWLKDMIQKIESSLIDDIIA